MIQGKEPWICHHFQIEGDRELFALFLYLINIKLFIAIFYTLRKDLFRSFDRKIPQFSLAAQF